MGANDIVQRGHGRIGPYSIDFTSEEVPVAGTVQSPLILCPGWKLIGEGNNADDGLVLIDTFDNGVGRLTTTDEDTEGMAIASNLIGPVGRIGTLRLLADVSMQAQTARNVFIGFGGVLGDVQTEIVTGATTTVTYVTTPGANIAGFMFDSQLTSKNWHIVHKGGTATAPTTTALCDSGVLPVNGEFDCFELIAYNNGTVEFWINGALIRTVEGALSTTVALGAVVGVWATATTIADLDVDYAEWSANRNWRRNRAAAV